MVSGLMPSPGGAGETGRADPVQKDFMTLSEKTAGRCLLLVQCTPREFENPVTDAAMKVMMVFLPGPFIESPQGRVVEPHEPTFFQEELHVPIDGGAVQCRNPLTPRLEDLIDSQRLVQLLKYLPNCLFLGRSALHTYALIVTRGVRYCKWICINESGATPQRRAVSR